MRIPVVIGFFGLLTLTTLACSKKEDSVVGKLEGFATAACNCKDLACADGVADSVQKLADSAGKMEDDDIAKAQTAQSRIDGCLVKANPVCVAYFDLAEQACACKDKACGEKVNAGFVKWASDLRARTATGKKLRHSDAQAVMEAGKKSGACIEKLGLKPAQ